MTLETITRNLCDAYQQLQPGTMLHVDELMKERRGNAVLRNNCFYTADGEIYLLDGVCKTPVLAMTREAHNPILKNIDDAFTQLTTKDNYHPSRADVRQALAAPDTVLIALPNLRLSGNEAEWRYLKIGTVPSEYGQLNGEERKLAERVYGQGNDFVQNMEMLKKAKIHETKIFVLNPDYVRKLVGESAVARASWLSNFNFNSLFNASDRHVYNSGRVRGVRRGSE